MSETSERMGRLQRWAADQDAKAARARELPRALCFRCGGVARAGEGLRHPEVPAMRADLNGEVKLFPPVQAPRDADGWRRECGVCADATMGELVSEIIGVKATDDEARAISGQLSWRDGYGIEQGGLPWASTVGRATGRPWGHVNEEDRARVRRVLKSVRAVGRLRACKQGACGMCGVRYSTRWWQGPSFLRWSDGSPAPVCATCQEVVDRRPAAVDIERLRTIAVEAATGSTRYAWGGAPAAFRLFAESKHADGNGHGEPWAYGPGIIAFREDVWTADPSLAPEDRREEFRARHEAIRAEQDEAHRDEREAKLATTW